MGTYQNLQVPAMHDTTNIYANIYPTWVHLLHHKKQVFGTQKNSLKYKNIIIITAFKS